MSTNRPIRRRLVWPLVATLVFGIAASLVFTLFPKLDIAFSRHFVTGPHDGFIFNYPGIGPTLRLAFRALFWAGASVVVLALLKAAATGAKPLRLSFPKWLFVLLCIALGPGLLVNSVLKDEWGRPRPVHTVEFGGTQVFTPPLVPSNRCTRNCSFVSGEAATNYALFFGLALVATTGRLPLLVAGLVAGTGAGFVRIAQGGHFLSDIVFAAVLMALTSLGLYWLVFRAGRNLFAENGPLHCWIRRTWTVLGTFGRVVALTLFCLTVAATLLYLLDHYNKRHQIDLRFDGTRVLVLPTNLRTGEFTLDLIARAEAPDTTSAQLSELELPVLLMIDELQLVQADDRYLLRNAGHPPLAAFGMPLKWQRLTLSASSDGPDRVFVNGKLVWSGDAIDELHYSTIFVGATRRPDSFWTGTVYSVALWPDVTVPASFAPTAAVFRDRLQPYIRRVNRHVSAPPTLEP